MMKPSRFILFLASIMFLIPAAGRAQDKEEIGHFQISLSPKRQIVNEYASIEGLRLSLPYSRNRNVRGLDLGFVNRAEGYFEGLGIGVLMNSCRDGMRGMTISPWNAVEYDAKGAQIGLLNTMGMEIMGCQIGLLNLCDTLRGFQIGGYNYAWRVTGTQIGVVNITGYLKGFQIGLANVITDRYHWRMLPIVRGGW
ncbi:MAG: hypothetical protein R6V03_01040 [Kiritimatiellia bacterium]